MQIEMMTEVHSWALQLEPSFFFGTVARSIVSHHKISNFAAMVGEGSQLEPSFFFRTFAWSISVQKKTPV